MKPITLFLFLITLSFTGCHKDESQSKLPLNMEIEIKTGQTLINEANVISLKLDSVLNESRCPINALCVWAGNVEAKFIFKSREGETTFRLNSSLEPKDSLVDGYLIQLLAVSPYPVWNAPIKQSDYIARVKVVKQ